MAKAVTKNSNSWQAKLDKILREKNAFTDILESVEQKTKVRRSNIVLALGVILALYLMIGYGAVFLCNFIGFLYPAYASVKAIESPNKDEDTKWLTYWVVYTLFSLTELVTDILLWWIPFYWFFKCGFLIYCMIPIQKNGSVVIYRNIIRPFVLKNQKDIDKAFDNAVDFAQDAVNKVMGAELALSDEPSDAAKEAIVDAASEVVRHNLVDSSKTD